MRRGLVPALSQRRTGRLVRGLIKYYHLTCGKEIVASGRNITDKDNTDLGRTLHLVVIT